MMAKARNRASVTLQTRGLIFICMGALALPMRAQDSTATHARLRLMADAIVSDATFRFIDRSGKTYAAPEKARPDEQLRPESPYNDWRYWNGVLNIAMIRLGEVFVEPAFIRYAQENITFSFDHYGFFENRYDSTSKWEYPFAQRFIMEELDDCGAMGASLLEVNRRDPQDRYKNYIDQTAQFMLNKQHRLDDGTFVRPFPPKWTVWTDDLYMSVSFLSRMGEWSGDVRYFDDAALQVINFHKHLFDETRGLMVHCWYADVDRPGVAFWGRANGWALLAQVDLLDRLPSEYPERDTLLHLLRKHIMGIARYQGGDGLWHQLLDKTDSYLETSCSAMFTYTVARAVNKGYIEPRYASIALRGWEGVMSKILSDGQVEGVCAGTGVSDDLVHYYRRPTPLNDIHGIGAVILAGVEILQLKLR